MNTTYIRFITLLLTAVLLCAALALPVSATEPAWALTDDAELLTANQLQELDRQIRTLTAQYQTDFVIVTVDSLGGKSPKQYANDFYDDNNCGFGENRDGILLLLAMASREYYFLTVGSATEKLAQAGGIATLENKVVPYLSSGNYYQAFDAFLDIAASIVSDPTSVPNASYNDDFVYVGFDDVPSTEDRLRRVGLFAVLGVIAGLVTTLLMKRGMKTARAKNLATDYVRPGSFHLTRKMDLYLYRTRTRVRVQSNNGSSSGTSRSGGGSRGGGSRGGGGGRF
jgi:uncharacterized protein